MKCRCCNFEFPQDEGKCPRCRFPVIYLPGDSGRQAEEQIQESVRRYRRDHYGELRIAVTQYTWKQAGEHIELNEKTSVPLCSAAELMEKGEIILDRLFARTPSEKTIELEYTVGDAAGRAAVEAPTDVSFWRIGARIQDGLQFCFLLKSDGQCSASAPISLV